ncbi:hypothetical protein RYX36_014595 [Vicia faba]
MRETATFSEYRVERVTLELLRPIFYFSDSIMTRSFFSLHLRFCSDTMTPPSLSSSHHPSLLRLAVLSSLHFTNSASKTLSGHESSSVSLSASSNPQVRFNPSESSPKTSFSPSSFLLLPLRSAF